MNTDTQIPPEAPKMRLASPAVWVVVAALLAATLKLCIALNTEGTNDVLSFHQFASDLDQHGLEWTYQHRPMFNHPPLVAYFLRGIYSLGTIRVLRENGLTFPFWLRLPGIIKPEMADRWAPWLIWPWLAFVAALTTEWLRTRRRNPSTRLPGLKSSGDSNP